MNSTKYLVNALNTIIRTRKSCKNFKKQSIDEKTMTSILKSINQCPSSFGLEPWKIIVIKNQEIKLKIQKFCDNQKQVANCSHLFVVLCYKGKMFEKDNSWMISRAKEKRNLKNHDSYLKFYEKSFMSYMKEVDDWNQWSIRQSYILLQTILLTSSAHNLVTSPIEGSKLNKIVPFLEENNIISEKDTFICPFVVALGYNDDTLNKKVRKYNSIEDTFIIIN